MINALNKCHSVWKNQQIPETEEEWKDDLFPQTEKAEMKKLNEMIGDYCLLKENVTEGIQFSFEFNGSNSSFIEILNRLMAHPSILNNCLSCDDDIKPFFKVKLFIEGKWQIVLLDLFFPYDCQQKTIDLKPYSLIVLKGQVWPIVLQKALVKVNGGDKLLRQLTPSVIFNQITSFPCEVYGIKEVKDHLINYFASKEECLAVAIQLKDELRGCVSIIQTAKAELNEEIDYLLLIHPSLKGKLIEGCNKLNSLIELRNIEETSWVSLKEFSDLFSQVAFCYFFFDSFYTTIHIEEKKTQFPIGFVLELKESSKVALTFTLSSIESTDMSVVIAQQSSFNSNEIAEVKGFHLSIHNTIANDIVMNCSNGHYIYWFSSFNKIGNGYSIRLMAESPFTISSIQQNSDSSILKRIIYESVNLRTEDYDDDDIIHVKEDSFFSSGISYYCIKNSLRDACYIASVDGVKQNERRILPGCLSASNEVLLYSDNSLILLFQNKFGASKPLTEVKLNKIKEGRVEDRKDRLSLSELLPEKELFIKGFEYYKTIPNIKSKLTVTEKDKLKFDTQRLSDLTKINFPLTLQSKENGRDYQWTVINYKNAIYLGSITKENNEKNGRGCLFFSKDNYYVCHWKNDQMEGEGVHYLHQVKAYEGSFYNGKYEGLGIQWFPNGSKYEGKFKEGLFNGEGTLFFPQGNRYEGCFIEGIEEGHGRLFFANGDSFEGNFSKGKPNDFGMFLYSNGGYYKGMFAEGKRKGKGQLKFDGNNIFNGFFDNDQFNGFGVLHYSNGDVYQGDFVNGLRQGKGRLDFSEGDYYEGDFDKGELIGEGTLSIGDNFIYKGSFVKGEFQGQGILNYFNGNIYSGCFSNGLKSGFGFEFLHNGDQYEGYFAMDKYEGKGKFTYSGGNYYEGAFSKGQFDGEGTLLFDNGDKYEGSFKQGIREGKGYFYFDEGNIYEGDFKNDSFDGEGILYKKNGDIIEGTFKLGLLCGKAVYYPKDDLPYDIDTNNDKDEPEE